MQSAWLEGGEQPRDCTIAREPGRVSFKVLRHASIVLTWHCLLGLELADFDSWCELWAAAPYGDVDQTTFLLAMGASIAITFTCSSRIGWHGEQCWRRHFARPV
jgi:hypothetical protein